MSKGSKPRPIQDKDRYSKEWDRIFGKNKDKILSISPTDTPCPEALKQFAKDISTGITGYPLHIFNKARLIPDLNSETIEQATTKHQTIGGTVGNMKWTSRNTG